MGKEEKDACIQIRGLAELMGTRRAAFFCEGEGKKSHLHNGKAVGVGAESSPLVGTVGDGGGWRGGRKRKSSYQTKGPIPRCCEGEMHAGDMLLRSLPPARFICETIYQQSRPRASLPPHSAFFENTRGGIAATSSR